MSGSSSQPNDSCNKITLNLCRAIESRWKRNCPSLSSAETEVNLRPRSFKNCTADSLIGSKVSIAIGWNVYHPDNAAYLACFLDAAISSAAPAEDAELDWNVGVCQRGSNCNVSREGQTCLPRYQCQTVKAFAVTAKEIRRFLRDWNFGCGKHTWDDVVEDMMLCDSTGCHFTHESVEAPCIHLWPTPTGMCSAETQTEP